MIFIRVSNMAECQGGSDIIPDDTAAVQRQAFTNKGEYDDEVTLRCDGGKELYFPRDLLKYASPVFKEVLMGNKEGLIEVPGQQYSEMMLFLIFIHPNPDTDIEPTITDTNVFTLLNLAEEYKVKKLIKQGKHHLRAMTIANVAALDLKDRDRGVTVEGFEMFKTSKVASSFKVISAAVRYGYTDVEDEAAVAIAKVSSKLYSNKFEFKQQISNYPKESSVVYSFTSGFGMGTKSADQLNKDHIALKQKRLECRQLFDHLPDAAKFNIVKRRLALFENDSLH